KCRRRLDELCSVVHSAAKKPNEKAPYNTIAGSPYYGRPEFDPATARTMVLAGVGGHVHPRGERWGFLDRNFPGLRTAVHVDGVVNSRTNADRGWTVELAFPWRGMDVESPRALRFAHPGSVPLRDVFGEDGGMRRSYFFTRGAMIAVSRSGVAVSRVRCGYFSPPW